MKRVYVLFFLLIMTCVQVSAQPYPVGHRQMTYTDASRSNRSVDSHVYYPGLTAGDDVGAASGSFPLIVFGHGFIMGDPDLYSYILQGLAAEGYICLFPTTENGSVFPPPDHLEFGKDLAFLNTYVRSENTNSASFLYNKIAPKSAIMGHSMGGKATFLAAGLSNDITTIVTMGAAISNPPIGGSTLDVLGDYATNVTIPCFVISAELDCVAPPAANQLLLYDTVSSDCKYFAQITGGGHCYFASQAGGIIGCESGELTCSSFSIDRSQQNQTVLDLIMPWFGYILRDNNAARIAFDDTITSSSRITYRKNCNLHTGIDDFGGNLATISGNPFSDELKIHFSMHGNQSYRIVLQDITGRVVFHQNTPVTSEEFIIFTSSLSEGTYIISIEGAHTKSVKKILKIAG